MLSENETGKGIQCYIAISGNIQVYLLKKFRMKFHNLVFRLDISKPPQAQYLEWCSKV